MLHSPSKLKPVRPRSLLLSILLLVALAGLVACGAGGGSFHQTQQGGGGGGGGGNGPDCAHPAPVTASATVTAGLSSGVTPSTFMDLHVGGSDLLTDVSIPYGSLRLWDTGTGWAEINTPAFGKYDWSNLDGFVNAAPAGVDLLYNLARTPNWASSNPNDSSCAYADLAGGNGQCWPPTDLNSDGSGTDKDWIQWVTDVATRYQGRIKYYEIWNEWNISKFWQGSAAQLVRMEQDARCVVEGPPKNSIYTCHENGSVFPSGMGIDTSAQIVTPSPVGAHPDLNQVSLQLTSYFGTTVGGIRGGTFADVIGFHGYVGTKSSSNACPNPEEVNTVVDDLNASVMAAPGEAGKPWFNTEGGWSKATDEGFTDPDRQAAFLARYFLLQRSLGVDRTYWYRWDATSTYGGALWTSSSGITEAGTADGEVYDWIVGATLSTACTVNSKSVWTCGFTRPGWQGLAVWDASQDCLAGTCGTTNFSVPGGVGYTEYLDLTGKSTSVSGGTVPIGAKPILLETGSLP